TLDELIGAPGMTPDRIAAALTAAPRPEGLNVFAVHTEVEGRHHAALFETILRRWQGEGWTFETLETAAARATAACGPPLCSLERSEVAGRAGWVSTQGPTIR